MPHDYNVAGFFWPRQGMGRNRETFSQTIRAESAIEAERIYRRDLLASCATDVFVESVELLPAHLQSSPTN